MLRGLLQRLRVSFVDAEKEEYSGVNLASERRRVLSAPGLSFEYAGLDLNAWLQEIAEEFHLPINPRSCFDELEYAQLQIAFHGPCAPRDAFDTINALLQDDEERRNYLNGLLFMYHTHLNPFRRLEAIVVHVLTTGTFLCYETSSTPFFAPMPVERSEEETQKPAS